MCHQVWLLCKFLGDLNSGLHACRTGTFTGWAISSALGPRYFYFAHPYNILDDSKIPSVPAFVFILTFLAWIRTRREKEQTGGKLKSSDLGIDWQVPEVPPQQGLQSERWINGPSARQSSVKIGGWSPQYMSTEKVSHLSASYNCPCSKWVSHQDNTDHSSATGRTGIYTKYGSIWICLKNKRTFCWSLAYRELLLLTIRFFKRPLIGPGKWLSG